MDKQIDLSAILAEHVDCDYTVRIPSGLEEINPERLQQILSESSEPTVIKFGKDFCGWTKKLNRVLQVVVPEYADKAGFYEINIPTYNHLVTDWDLDTSPIMILFKDGREVARTDAAEAHEVVPVFAEWFGEPA